MKCFVISDIHSHYDAMITALKKHGYDSKDDNHHLIVLGDLFDRGNQPIEVLEYLYPLSTQKKATIILGNHDTFLLDFLDGNSSRTMFNITHNGFGKTLYYLSGIVPDENVLDTVREKINERFSYLHKFLQSFPLYYELGDYIFVHGGIDGRMLDWKMMQSQRDFVWGREIDLEPIPGKIVVAGHHRVATIRVNTKDYQKLHLHDPSQFDILYKEGKILIDRYVEISDEINVLELEI